MDPVIFSFSIGNFDFALHWYGVLVMTGVIVAAWIANREISRRGGKGELVWDALIILLPVGIVGARLWYVLNSVLGGNDTFVQNPAQILNIMQGGLHFFGGLLFGAVALYFYARHHKLDMWLLLDSIAPATMIGQAVARPANFINQELYGQPTDLPWGIAINPENRIPTFADMSLYPESTRFHPAFAYEMVWNFATAGALLWVSRRYPDKFKPGAVFAWWLVLAGAGRVIIEAFRPDQPRVPGSDLSYSRLVAAVMAIIGIVILLVRNRIIRLPFAENWRERYTIFTEKSKKTIRKKMVKRKR